MRKNFEKHLNLRIMGKDGWLYFCRQCGDYLPFNNFYKRKNTPWGIDSTCKNHGKKLKIDYDADMEYLKLNPITENDFIEMRDFLTKLGYDFNGDKSVHEQFMEKHNLNKK
jgi:hypothetical protein